jgi:CubicO group peptidase (beta-lactamase class C family)
MAVNRKLILFVLLIIAISFNPIALETAVAPDFLLVPENVRLINGYSSSDDFVAAEKNISTLMRKWSLTGASVAVAVDGKLVYAKGFGVTDTISDTEVQPYNRFRIASISKLITAAAIMKLAEEGKLSLEDKVFGPLAILNDPYFNNPKDKRVYDITVNDLLTHKGGWSQRYGDQMFMPVTIAERMGVKPPADTKTIVRYALDRNLHFTPGKGRSYSNLGYSILGLVVEKISGTTYELYCREEILEPIGIFDMRLGNNLQTDKSPYEVSYYTPSDILLKPSVYGTGELLNPSNGGNDIEALGGAGAWIATAPDLMRLLLALDGFDNFPDILSPESIAYMSSQVNGEGPIGWKSTSGNGTWTRTGSFPGTSGMMRRLPDGTAWVVLFNSSAWNGPQVQSYVSSAMSRFIRQFKESPTVDLYDYYIPVPLMADND